MKDDILISVEINDDIIEINKYWHKLEFDKIMAMLAEECSFSMTKEMAFEIKPKKNIEKVKLTLAETTEAVDIMRGQWRIQYRKDIALCYAFASTYGIAIRRVFCQQLCLNLRR